MIYWIWWIDGVYICCGIENKCLYRFIIKVYFIVVIFIFFNFFLIIGEINEESYFGVYCFVVGVFFGGKWLYI